MEQRMTLLRAHGVRVVRAQHGGAFCAAAFRIPIDVVTGASNG